MWHKTAKPSAPVLDVPPEKCPEKIKPKAETVKHTCVHSIILPTGEAYHSGQTYTVPVEITEKYKSHFVKVK